MHFFSRSLPAFALGLFLSGCIIPAHASDDLVRSISFAAMQSENPEVLPAVQTLVQTGFIQEVAELARSSQDSGKKESSDCSSRNSVLARTDCAMQTAFRKDPRVFLGSNIGLSVAKKNFTATVSDVKWPIGYAEHFEIEMMFPAYYKKKSDSRTCFATFRVRTKDGDLEHLKTKCI